MRRGSGSVVTLAGGHVRGDLEVACEPGHGIAAAIEYARQQASWAWKSPHPEAAMIAQESSHWLS